MTATLTDLLAHCPRDRTYSRQLTQVTGAVTATVLLAWLWEQAQGDWWANDGSAIAHQTGLSLPEQEFARQQLRRRGLLREQLLGDQLHFQVHTELLAQKLQSLQQLVPKAGVEQPKVETTGDRFFLARRATRPAAVTPDYQFIGPWQSAAQLEAFQRSLWQYYLQQGNSNPREQVFYVVDGLTKGLVSPLWDDFIQGQPLGSSQQVQRDWEIAPGQPYPAFEEERIQYYCHKGEPIEVATARARADLRQPTLAQDLWEGFLRKCDRLADEALKAQQQGVRSPYLPATFAAQSAPNKQAVMAKLSQLQGSVPQLETPPPVETAPPSIPSLETLQEAYANPIGRTLIRQQIEQHPEWGYGIENDEIIDLEPF
ncbi:MAG: hypothetical protein F6J87_29190 [Spirulina sp. SIO3F2]|nr:hypothetical protein [Spirulina sp. SIO3F2]